MRHWWSILSFGVITACTLGPQNPTVRVSLPPAAPSFAITPAAGPAQHIQSGADPADDWWREFRSPALNILVNRALAANNDLANADALLRQAREQAAAAAGAALPQIDASYQAQRIRTSQVLANPLPNPDTYLYSLHTTQLSVVYPLDLFGGARSKLKSARAAAEVAADRRDAARVTIIANLVLAVIQQASLRAQIHAATTAVRNNQEILDLLRKRQVLGEKGAADVANQQTALANAEAVLPPLQRELDRQCEQISILIGIAPGLPLPVLPNLDELTLPATLPLSLPSEIVAHRPDVRAAEAQMRGAGADVGAAIAARLPSITLTGTAGGEATRFADMFTNGNLFWTLVGGVTQPIFHAGQLLHQQRAAEAALDSAKAQYRSTVLQAFSDTTDALSGLRTDASELDAAARASTAADQSLGFADRQFKLGGIGMLPLLYAAAAAAQAHLQLIQARAARLSDTVGLMQAVGGSLLEQTE